MSPLLTLLAQFAYIALFVGIWGRGEHAPFVWAFGAFVLILSTILCGYALRTTRIANKRR